MKLDAKQLRHLRAVIENKTFARAAEVLGVSQPALSRSIANLEKLIGARLLVRGRHGAEPTAFGQALSSRSSVIDAELRQATQDIQRLKTAKAGQLVLGSSMVPSARVVPRAVAALQIERPGLSVKIVEYFESDLLMAVQLGDIDLMLGPTYKAIPGDDLVEQSLFSTSVAVMTRKGHRLARRKRLQMSDLVDESWVGAITATSLRRFVETLTKNAGIPALKTTLHTDSLHLLKMLVAQTDHFTLLPLEVAESEVRAGLLDATPLDAPGNDWPHGYRLHADKMRDPLVRAFISQLRRTCAEL